MKKILAIDQGTSSSRAIVFSGTGDILHVSQRELHLIYPQNGWVEQNPDDILADTFWCIQDCLKNHPDILTIGITNQRETTIIWDKETGKPVYNAIVWQDRRTTAYCHDLKSDEKIVREKTGLFLDPYFSATKINWILKNVTGARSAADAGKLLFGTVDSFLLWHLTSGKVHATDMTNASRTMLFNIHELAWDDDLLRLFDIPKALLPELKENVFEFGTYQNIPINAMVGDQQAALIGQGCVQSGMMKSTYGTGCFALMNIGPFPRLSQHQLLTSLGYIVGGEKAYVFEGSIFVAGAAIQWLRDEMGFFDTADQSEDLARSVDDTNGVYFIPAFTGLGAPYWAPDVRGALLGLTRGTKKAHITRAALEAQAYQTRDLMEAMIADSGVAVSALRVDGGLARNGLMTQFLSDILNMQVDIPKSVETTALGAAYLAAIGHGIFKGLKDVSTQWSKEKSFLPAIDENKRRIYYDGWKKSIHRLI
jgi:glycerol kinase